MPTVHCAVKAVIKRGEDILLLRQDVGGSLIWDLPGGRMVHGERAEDAVHREVTEETGLTVKIDQLLGVWHFFRKADGDQVVCITYLCELVNDEEVDLTKNETGETIDTSVWVRPDRVRDPEFAAMPEGLRELLVRL